MKTKTLGWIVAVGLAGTLGFGACTQPKTECQVALASTQYTYAAKFKLKAPPAAGCEGIVTPGGTFGMEFYHPPSADGTTYDSSKTTFAVRSEDLGNYALEVEDASFFAYDSGWNFLTTPSSELEDESELVVKCGKEITTEPPDEDLSEDQLLDRWLARAACYCAGTLTPEEAGRCQCVDPTDLDNNPCDVGLATGQIYSKGTFASAEPDEGDFCSGTLPAADGEAQQFKGFLEVPASPDDNPDYAGQGALPARDIKYEWKDPKFYVTAAAPGTQFSADLRYTENGCTVDYEVVAMWPAIYCGGYDEDGNPTFADPDDTACDPCPPPGAPYGSGISPDFPTKCDPDLFYCVLKDAKDQTKDATSIPQLLDAPIECEDGN